MKTEDNQVSLVSVIIPVFNGNSFIRDAYNIILKQNLLKFEIIFVDNNSTDDSLKIINDIIKKDSRVSLYKEFTQGAASARNKGLNNSKGDFIYFFDVDDELFDNALKSLLEILINDYGLDSVHGNILKSNIKLRQLKNIPVSTNKLTIPAPYYWGIRWMNYGTLPGTPSFLHRKRVFSKVGNFNTQLKLGEDAAFHVKLGMECKIAHIDKNILLYYRHQKSTVSNQNKKQAKVFTYWEPLILEHIPYMITHEVPLAFKIEVLKRVYAYIPKMLALTEGLSHRRQLKNKLLTEIKPLKIPVFLGMFHSLISITGSLDLYKFYAYYVLSYYIKYFIK